MNCMFFFFFKQKTAYEMRISDWSSDVCSSDLLLAERGTVVTNGAGINAITIAEYVVMGMLTVAKGYREVVRAQERREWLHDSPGKAELFGSKALLLGYGAIGKLIEERLKGFAVDVTVVRRSRSEEHTSELQSLMRSSNACLC